MNLSNLPREPDELREARERIARLENAGAGAAPGYAGQTYYNERHARELIALILHMRDKGRESITLSAIALNLSFRSLDQQLRSARQYIMDKLRDEDEYVLTRAAQMIIGKKSADKIEIRFQPTVRKARSLLEAIEDDTDPNSAAIDMDELRRVYEEFLESDPREKKVFERKNLRLSKEDIEWFRTRLAVLPRIDPNDPDSPSCFDGVIREDYIKIVPMLG